MPRYNPLTNGKRRVRATSSSSLPTVPSGARRHPKRVVYHTLRMSQWSQKILVTWIGMRLRQTMLQHQGWVPVLLVVTMGSRWRRWYGFQLRSNRRQRNHLRFNIIITIIASTAFIRGDEHWTKLTHYHPPSTMLWSEDSADRTSVLTTCMSSNHYYIIRRHKMCKIV